MNVILGKNRIGLFLFILSLSLPLACTQKSKPVSDSLDLKNESKSAVPEKKIKFYRNPMDPTIHSDHPTQDNMGMDYLPVYESGQTFSSGVITWVVEKKDLLAEIRVPGRVLGGSRVSFQAFEQDTPLLKVGMEFEGETPTAPGIVFKGKITFVDSILDPMTRTLRVDGLLFSAGQASLKTEASMIGTLKTKLSQVVAIPEEAVLHTGTRNLVYISDGHGSFSPRTVILGNKALGFYEIKSGLSTGEEISSGPNFLLDSESKIEFSP